MGTWRLHGRMHGRCSRLRFTRHYSIVPSAFDQGQPMPRFLQWNSGRSAGADEHRVTAINGGEQT
jgi:hypothetical protein